MAIKVQLSGVQTGTFEALPNAVYPVHVFEIEEKTGQDSGEPYLSFVFKIDEGHEHAGRQFWHNISLSEKALWNFKRVMIALGVPAEDLEAEYAFEISDHLGKACSVRVITETFDNVARNKVKAVLPAGTEVDEAGAMTVDDL